MALITWSASLSVGIGQLDKQHQKLIEMINGLHDAMMQGKGRDVLSTTLDGLVAYTASHFANEERLMADHGFPGQSSHQAEHRQLVEQVQTLARDLKDGKPVLTIAVMSFLRDWLNNHILGTDKKYGPYLTTRGVS
jgi:hemerythrin